MTLRCAKFHEVKLLETNREAICFLCRMITFDLTFTQKATVAQATAAFLFGEIFSSVPLLALHSFRTVTSRRIGTTATAAPARTLSLFFLFHHFVYY
jgi:hypothetical protein